MVLKILYAVGSSILPTKYLPHLVAAILGVVIAYALAQGRYTTRERDLHGRTILITVAYHLDVLVSLAELIRHTLLRELSPRMG